MFGTQTNKPAQPIIEFFMDTLQFGPTEQELAELELFGDDGLDDSFQVDGTIEPFYPNDDDQ